MLVRLAAVGLVLPLLVPAVWGGLRLGVWDLARSVVTPSEGALGVRDPVGVWAVGVALGWFGLAYRGRNDWRWWELGLIILGGTAALVRVGNAWLDGLAVLLPIARQLQRLVLPAWVLAGLTLVGGATAAALLLLTQPAPLPDAARTAALAAGGSGRVFSYWQWAPQLQRDVGTRRDVLAADGIGSGSEDFWLDYLRVSQGHERWTAILDQQAVDVVVLNSREQAAAAALVRAAPDWQVLDDADGALVARRGSP